MTFPHTATGSALFVDDDRMCEGSRTVVLPARFAPCAAVSLLAASLFLLVPAHAFAQDVIYGCVQLRSDGRGDHHDDDDRNRNDSGFVRIVAANQVCRRHERRIQWNAVGPAGPVGPEGATGATGLQGPAGENGEVSVTGDGGAGGDTTEGFISALMGEGGQLPQVILPGGASYLLTANVTFSNGTLASKRASCRLVSGGVPFGAAEVTVPGAEFFEGAANVTVLGSIVVSGEAASVTVGYETADGDYSSFQLQSATLTAIRVGPLTIQ